MKRSSSEKPCWFPSTNELMYRSKVTLNVGPQDGIVASRLLATIDVPGYSIVSHYWCFIFRYIYKDWVNGIPSQSMAPDTQLLSKFVLFAHKMVLHLKAYCPEFWWCHVQYWQPSLALHRSLQAGQLTTSLVVSPPTMPLE